jgi:hypothetical protein
VIERTSPLRQRMIDEMTIRKVRLSILDLWGLRILFNCGQPSLSGLSHLAGTRALRHGHANYTLVLRENLAVFAGVGG